MRDEVIWAERALLPQGWAENVRVTLRAGRIAAIEADTAPGTAPGGQRVGTLLPAPTDLHSHAFQRAMAGRTEARGPDPRDSFWTWRRLMYRFLDQLTPEDVEAITAFAQMEMLEAGFAAVAEFHYLHHAPGGVAYADPAEMSARIVAAAAETGIGLTLLPVLYQHGGCDGRRLTGGQQRFGCTPEAFGRLWQGAAAAVAALPDARIGVAPHSLRAVTPEGLTLAESLAPEAPIHIHAAEQTAEVEEVLAFHGARPVAWLLANRGVDPRWCLIHCTQMEPSETRALAASGAVAGLCPITEASLGDGIFDGARYLAAGGRFGVGSDSNIRLSLAEELRGLEYSQRLRDRGRAVLATRAQSTGRVLFEGAVAGGAQAAGRPAGAIAPGRLADLVALAGDHPDLAGCRGDGVLDAWIFAGDNRMVAEVWAAGRHLVSAGRHLKHDEITRRYMKVMAALEDRL